MAMMIKECNTLISLQVRHIHKDLDCKTASYMKRGELFIVMQVCKMWRDGAQCSAFWKRERKILGIKTHDMALINKEIMMLKEIVKQADPQLAERKNSINICEGFDEKDKLIVLGLHATVQLFRLELRTTEQAVAYLHCFESIEPVMGVVNTTFRYLFANALIANGKIKEAPALIEPHMKDFPIAQKSRMVCDMAYFYLREGFPHKGLELLKNYSTQDTTLSVCEKFKECTQTLLNHSVQSRV